MRWSVSHGRKRCHARSLPSLTGASPGAWQACAGPRVAVRFILPQFQCPGCSPSILDALFTAARAAGTRVSQATSSLRAPVQFSSVASHSATPSTAARRASLSITNSRSLLKLMSIESVMPSSHLILWRPLLLPSSTFPSIRVFSIIQLFASGGENIGVSASTSVLPMNTQD